MTQRAGSGSLETAVRFAADEPGWIERTLARHTARPSGDCAGCGTYRPLPWPCVLVWIAREAQRIVAERDEHAAGPHQASGAVVRDGAAA